MRCKVILGQDARSWRYPKENKYSHLQEFIVETFSSVAPDTTFFVRYRDDEGELMTISSEEDLEEAFVVSRDDERKSLKLFVVTGRVEELHQTDSDVMSVHKLSVLGSPRQVSKGVSYASQASSEFEIVVQDSEVEQDIKLPSDEPLVLKAPIEPEEEEEEEEEELKSDEDHENDGEDGKSLLVSEDTAAPFECEEEEEEEEDEEEQGEQGEQSEQTLDWRTELKTFMADVAPVTTEALQQTFDELSAQKKTLAGVLQDTFESFEELSNHPTVQKLGGSEEIGRLSQPFNSWTAILLQLGMDNVKTVLPQLVEAAIESQITREGQGDVCVDMAPLFRKLFPEWFAVLEQRLAKSQGQDVTVDLTKVFQANDARGVAKVIAEASSVKKEEEDEMEPEEVVHPNIICDVCEQNPLRGVRYKCTIRPNYDLCEKCESERSEAEKRFPMIKIKVPVSNAVGAYRFIGAQEFCRQVKHSNPHKFGRRYHHHHPHGFGGHWHHDPRGPPPMHPRFPFGRFGPPHGFPHGPPPPQHHHFHPHHHAAAFQANGSPLSAVSEQAPPAFPSRANSTQSTVSTPKKLKAAFVDDISIPDRSQHPPNCDLIKTWKMRNVGNCAWGGEQDPESKTKLVFLKGHEYLTTEKEFAVPYVQPGQEVNVSACIRTPERAGRYCSYYRLQKEGVKFGPRIWVDIFVKEQEAKAQVVKKMKEAKIMKMQKKAEKKLHKLEAKQKKIAAKLQAKEMQKAKVISKIQHLHKEMVPISCLCGQNLVPVMAKKCYAGEFVHCDLCGAYIDANKNVYHCPSSKDDPIHPNGYDVCAECIAHQREVFSKTFGQKKDDEPVAPKKPVVEPKKPVVEPEPEPEPVVEPIVEPVVEQPKPIVDEKPPAFNPSAPPMPAFEYAEQLNAIQSMGFENKVAISELLMLHKGNMETVINTLLSQF